MRAISVMCALMEPPNGVKTDESFKWISLQIARRFHICQGIQLECAVLILFSLSTWYQFILFRASHSFSSFEMKVLHRLSDTSADGSPLTMDHTVTLSADTTTVGELLLFKYDLCSIPKKATVLKLAQWCQDPAEALQLRHLCSKSEVIEITLLLMLTFPIYHTSQLTAMNRT